jgi:predicted nucleic acid-binding protein
MTILDTNVVSEIMRPEPAETVIGWLAACPATDIFITALTQAEILTGIELLPRGKRRTDLKAAWETMLEQLYSGRILPFDSDAAREFPGIVLARRKIGRPVTQIDAQIAAIARSRGAVIATRNIADFAHCGVDLLNPWTQ